MTSLVEKNQAIVSLVVLEKKKMEIFSQNRKKYILEYQPHPGIGPYGDNTPTKYHSYYQWVPYLLFLQVIKVNYNSYREDKYPFLNW